MRCSTLLPEALEGRLFMDSKVLSDFPAYHWYNGCTPTAVGMILGYYDRRQFTEIFPGTDARTRDSIVSESIASTAHRTAGQENRPTNFFNRYIGAGDWHNSPSYPNHEQNPDCIADFIRTENGGTYLEHLQSGIVNYLKWRGYTSGWSVGNRTMWSAASFQDIVESIDDGRPLLGLVDFTGDGVTDHGTAIIGYNTDNNTYAVQDPNDSFVRWTRWIPPTAGTRFGVDSFYQIYPPDPATPFGEAPITAPGVIEAEDYDQGHIGRAYWDVDRRNFTGLYRSGGVGLDATSDTGGGYLVGWTHAGEWLSYTIDVTSSGAYRADIRVACPDEGATFHLEIDGRNVTGSIAMPATGDWDAWTTVSSPLFDLIPGRHTLRLVFDANSPTGFAGNVNWMRLTNTSLPQAPTDLVATGVSTSQISLSWLDNATNELGFLIQRRAANGGSWNTIATVGADVTSFTDSGLPASTSFVYRLVATNDLGASDYSNEAAAVTLTPLPTPYLGKPFSTGQTIKAENFDDGGQGLAYHDTTATNTGGQYRAGGVDIGAADAGGYYVGWTRSGEWMAYTINVATTGKFTFEANVASARAGGTFHVEVDGVNVTGSIAVPNTGAWQTWKTVSCKGIRVTAGRHVVKVVMDAANTAGNVGNFRWIRFR